MSPLRRRELLAATLAATSGWLLPARAADDHALTVRPLGPGVGEPERRMVSAALEAFYAFPVTWASATRLPKGAWYPPRQRYRAERLLGFLAEHLADDAGGAGASPAGRRTVLGLTARDISTTKEPHEDWGVLGLAQMGGPAAVVSSFRTKRRARSRHHALERLGKVAVHEVGHALGLPHCETEGCLMEDAGGTVDTLDREATLCALCRDRLASAGVPLAQGTPPWGR